MAVVLALRPPSGIKTDAVLVEDFGGAATATARLPAGGNRSVGFPGSPPALYTDAERFRSYRAAHGEAGRTPHEECVRRGPHDIPVAIDGVVQSWPRWGAAA